MVKKYIIFILIISKTFFSVAQNSPKITLVSGYSFLELFNIGFKIHYSENSQLGMYYGKSLSYNNQKDSFTSIRIDNIYSFDKKSINKSRQNWCIKEGLSYIKDSDIHDLFLCLNLEKNYYFSDRFYIDFDIGIFHSLIHKENFINQMSIYFGIKDYLILPSFGLHVNYIISK